MNIRSSRTPLFSRGYKARRCEPRYVTSVPVTLQRFLNSQPFVTHGMSLDISMGGMSALICGAPQVGETVVIELPLRNAPVELLATVRHSSDTRSGFEFYPLPPHAQQEIQNWIQEMSKQEEARFPYPYTPTAEARSR
jgi:PilZ domain